MNAVRINLIGQDFIIDRNMLKNISGRKWYKNGDTVVTTFRDNEDKRRTYTVARLVLYLTKGNTDPSMRPHFINGDRKDCRSENISLILASRHMLEVRKNNRTLTKKNRVTIFGEMPPNIYPRFRNKKISFDVMFRINGKLKYMGTFKCESEARAFVAKKNLERIVEKGCRELKEQNER